MVSNTHSKWGVRLGTLVLWGLAVASAVFWGLRLSTPAAMGLAPVAPAPVALPDAAALARLLGAQPLVPGAAPAAPAAASRFVLVGVLSGRHSGGGAALIAVDGKPARPYRVGAEVDAGMRVQSLAPRQVRLVPDGAGASEALTLEMAGR